MNKKKDVKERKNGENKKWMKATKKNKIKNMNSKQP